MVSWGIVMTLMGLVKDYKGLLIARLFLGVTEAGLFPGVAVSKNVNNSLLLLAEYFAQFYLTMWYCRHEMQMRQALFFSAASTAGAFSGLLAYAIAKMDGVGGLDGWRWIFILEGIATVLVAIFAFICLYDFPETASFLTEEERQFAVYRLKYQGGMEQASSENVSARVQEAQGFSWAYVRQAFGAFQVWIMVVCYWAVSLSVFMSWNNVLISLKGRLSNLRYQPISANYHQRYGIRKLDSPADDSSHLCHGLNCWSSRGLLL